MNSLQNKPLVIYVSGPYSPKTPESDPTLRKKIVEGNIEKANQIGIKIAEKGHLPFIPHTMMKEWEGQYFSREKALDICYEWVKRCDALYFIDSSEGAEAERKIAVQLHKPIYRNLEDVPVIPTDHQALSEEAFDAYKLEYEQCMESYRHTYDTIWQAGGLFSAISAAIIALATSNALKLFFPLPVILWFLGIFIPMNRYGEWRAQRLANLESLFNNSISGLQMSHFTDYDNRRKQNQWLNLLKGKWRVSHVVVLFGVLLIAVQVYLILFNFNTYIVPFFSQFP